MKNCNTRKVNIVFILVFACTVVFFSGCMKATTVGFRVVPLANSEIGVTDSATIMITDTIDEISYAVDEPAPTIVEDIVDVASISDTSQTDINEVATASETNLLPVPTSSATLLVLPSDDSAEPNPTATPSPKPSPTISVEAIDNKSGFVNAKSANLRKGPGTSYDVIKEYGQYEELIITGKSDDWYQIKIDGERGYMLAEFIEFGAVPTSTPSPTPASTPKPTPNPTPSPTPEATIAALSIDIASGNGFTEAELQLLAQLVHREANGTSLEAQKAVANSIYNRIMSSRFPSTVEGVVFQKNQYSPARDESKLRSTVPSQTSIDAVVAIFVNGELLLPTNVTFFKSASSGTTWNSISFLAYYATIGNNAFFIDTRDG